MKERLKITATLLALLLVAFGAGTALFKVTGNKPTVNESLKELNSIPSLTAKETPVEVFKVRFDIITVNSTGGLKDSDLESATLALQNTIINVCSTNKYDVVVADYMINGKLVSNSSFICSEFLSQFSQEV